MASSLDVIRFPFPFRVDTGSMLPGTSTPHRDRVPCPSGLATIAIRSALDRTARTLACPQGEPCRLACDAVEDQPSFTGMRSMSDPRPVRRRGRDWPSKSVQGPSVVLGRESGCSDSDSEIGDGRRNARGPFFGGFHAQTVIPLRGPLVCGIAQLAAQSGADFRRGTITGFRLDLLASDLGISRLDGRSAIRSLTGLFDGRDHLAQLVGKELHLRELPGSVHGTSEDFAIFDGALRRVEPERRRKRTLHFLADMLNYPEDTLQIEIPLGQSVRDRSRDLLVSFPGLIRLFRDLGCGLDGSGLNGIGRDLGRFDRLVLCGNATDEVFGRYAAVLHRTVGGDIPNQVDPT